MRATAVILAFACALAPALCLSEESPADQPRTAISESAVREAIAAQQVPLRGASLSMPFITARSRSPQLVVSSFTRLDRTHTAVRLMCRESFDCLPFYAYLSWRGGDAPLISAGAPDRDQSPAPARRAEPPTMRVGANATLILEGTEIEVSIPIVCLQPGRVGDVIRVASVNHDRVFLARVVSSTILKGTL